MSDFNSLSIYSYLVFVLSRRQAATVTADDVIIENVRDNNAGHLTFDMYVQSGGSAALPASAVQEAIEVGQLGYPYQCSYKM